MLINLFICAETLHQNVKQVPSTYLHLENLVLADSSVKSNKNADILNLYLELLLTSPL